MQSNNDNPGHVPPALPEPAAPHQIKSPSASTVGFKLMAWAIAMALALTIGFILVERHKSHESDALDTQSNLQFSQAPSVDVVKVSYAPASESLGYPGDTRGWYQSTIYARVNGYVDRWQVDIGDRVHKGQVLAVIDTPDLDAQLQAAMHELVVSQSQVDVMKANSDFARSTYERWKDSPKGVVSDQEREQKKAEYSSSMAQLRASEAKVSADQAEVDRLNAMEGYKQVAAPFDGVITVRHIDIGDLVTAGSTASTSSLYTMAQISKIRVFVDVPQRTSAGMEDNVPATVTTNELPDDKFEGKIARTSRAIDPVTRTLHVEVDIDNPKMLLMPGMYVQVNFDFSHKGLLRVPASALMFRAGGPQVAVVGNNGKVDFRDIHITVDNGDYVEIGSGVSVNEKVALNLSNQINQGDRVTAIDAEAGNKTIQVPAVSAKAEPRTVSVKLSQPH